MVCATDSRHSNERRNGEHSQERVGTVRREGSEGRSQVSSPRREILQEESEGPRKAKAHWSVSNRRVSIKEGSPATGQRSNRYYWELLSEMKEFLCMGRPRGYSSVEDCIDAVNEIFQPRSDEVFYWTVSKRNRNSNSSNEVLVFACETWKAKANYKIVR
nr:MAG TPA: protein of unknown function (DUF1508) [Caudoviricetes sp.]